jgi:hypothetical protein
MRKILIGKEVKELSNEIASKAQVESDCFPIDRFFLDKYINNILTLDKQQFLLYNFELINPTYSSQLMMCLPELWIKTNADDIEELACNFTNVFSYYTLINFAYTYIEIDMITFILEMECVDVKFKKEIISYTKGVCATYFKEKDDVFFKENLYGITLEQLYYVKQVLLLDNRLHPALETAGELHNYLTKLESKWNDIGA